MEKMYAVMAMLGGFGYVAWLCWEFRRAIEILNAEEELNHHPEDEAWLIQNQFINPKQASQVEA
ncbi:hypothetical protein BWI93_27340 [Siphonobacter sp. BAB-5385]|uniref:hypothetical protein n=1 Tax=Siphonobacter sp. BAB-5385 TaxID=1864822 RepID=UPI000B9E763A|nr:hypothetical protein [Siphonobacter sp. BAB-5385]OZI05104.1 hypothetical protein BWI93_27340 [Siphonobacter sp. BAB-5385]